jgi:hypothetical protein
VDSNSDRLFKEIVKEDMDGIEEFKKKKKKKSS